MKRPEVEQYLDLLEKWIPLKVRNEPREEIEEQMRMLASGFTQEEKDYVAPFVMDVLTNL